MLPFNQVQCSGVVTWAGVDAMILRCRNFGKGS